MGRRCAQPIDIRQDPERGAPRCPVTIADLFTPSFFAEQPCLETNLAAMQKEADINDVALCPHAKTHKSTALVHRQQQRDAEELTVANVKEAETFVDAGIEDVSVAYPVRATTSTRACRPFGTVQRFPLLSTPWWATSRRRRSTPQRTNRWTCYWRWGTGAGCTGRMTRRP